MRIPRRHFLRSAVGTASLLGLGNLGFLSRLAPVSAAEADVKPDMVRFRPEIEPLVRLIEDMSRDRLLEEIGARIRKGLSYRDVLTALQLAGVRNIQPRPIGFKFHAVLVVNSAHLASLASPDSERWLPIFWALDYFKSSQAQDVKEGDWTMASLDESKIPPAHKAHKAFAAAMDNWEEEAADSAVAGLARSASAHEIFELFAKYGARDFRDIGHKAIYVANSWRTLQCIGWQHAEPVLRSLAYGLLDRRGSTNPATSDLPEDRPGRRNWELKNEIREDWLNGRLNAEATTELLETVREGSAADAAKEVVSQINGGVSPASLWDAVFAGAGELLMRQPGIRALHAVTTSNALHFAWDQTRDDGLRKYLLLQAASFVPLFRGEVKGEAQIDKLEPVSGSKGAPVEDVLAEISKDRNAAAGKLLAHLKETASPKEFVDAARLVLFFKGQDAHDYKFSSAVLEDWEHMSKGWRERYLAASVFQLRGSGGPDNGLVKRTRAALAG
jgi:hypothetical protein